MRSTRDKRQRRWITHGSRNTAVAWIAGVLMLAVTSPIAKGATPHVPLSSAERAFVKSYVALVPNLNKASAAVVTAVSNAAKDTDAQVVSVFTGVAGQWSRATRPLLKLKAPDPDTALFEAVTRRVPAVETDLLATAQAGRRHSVAAGRAAGRQLALDFNALGVAVGALKKRFGLP
jgi:hypothetical protein